MQVFWLSALNYILDFSLRNWGLSFLACLCWSKDTYSRTWLYHLYRLANSLFQLPKKTMSVVYPLCLFNRLQKNLNDRMGLVTDPVGVVHFLHPINRQWWAACYLMEFIILEHTMFIMHSASMKHPNFWRKKTSFSTKASAHIHQQQSKKSTNIKTHEQLAQLPCTPANSVA